MSYCIECEGGSCPKHATDAQGEDELKRMAQNIIQTTLYLQYNSSGKMQTDLIAYLRAELSKQREQAQQELLDELEVHMGMVGHQHVSFDTPNTETERELSEFIQAKRLNLTKEK